MSHGTEHHNSAFSLPLAANQTAIDPVCGMTVDPATAAGSFAHAGTTYHFLQPALPGEVQGRSQQVLARLNRGDLCDHAAPVVPGANYTCPMHPEMVQDGPGTCPQCGMALEPMMPGAARRTTPNCAT